MDRYTKFKILTTAGFSLFLYDSFFTIKYVDGTAFESLLPKSTYILAKKTSNIDDENFFLYYSPNSQTYKIGYKICDENKWVIDKSSSYMLKISKNNAAFDTYDEHSHTIVNKSFVIGKPIFALNGFKLFNALEVDKSNFVIKKQEETEMDFMQ